MGLCKGQDQRHSQTCKTTYLQTLLHLVQATTKTYGDARIKASFTKHCKAPGRRTCKNAAI